jgi:hypothetical protein
VMKSISVDHGHNRPTSAQSADGEVMLDIEVAAAVAPLWAGLVIGIPQPGPVQHRPVKWIPRHHDGQQLRVFRCIRMGSSDRSADSGGRSNAPGSARSYRTGSNSIPTERDYPWRGRTLTPKLQ